MCIKSIVTVISWRSIGVEASMVCSPSEGAVGAWPSCELRPPCCPGGGWPLVSSMRFSQAAQHRRGVWLHQHHRLLRPAFPPSKYLQHHPLRQEEETEGWTQGPQVPQAELVRPACRVLPPERPAAGCHRRRREFGQKTGGRFESLLACSWSWWKCCDAVFDYAASTDRPAHLETDRNPQVLDENQLLLYYIMIFCHILHFVLCLIHYFYKITMCMLTCLAIFSWLLPFVWLGPL